MQTVSAFLNGSGNKLVVLLAIAFVATVILLIARNFLLKFLGSFSKMKSRFDNGFLISLKAPSFFWVLAIGLYIGVEVSDISERYTKPIIEMIHILLALSMTIVAANLSAHLFKGIVKGSDGGQIRSGLAVGMVRGAVMAIGAMVIFSILGISITPILTALGVGGLAVALALKDTLENLFAGIYLITDRTIRVGDVVKLESGQDGVVDDIGWRTIRIRTFNNTTIILPNIKLAQSLVTNFCIPNQKFGTSFTFMVGPDNDPDKVESIVSEILKKGSEDIVGIVGHPNPTVRFIAGILPGALEFTVAYHVEKYTDLAFTQHELKKRMFRAFRDQAVSLPPMRPATGSP